MWDESWRTTPMTPVDTVLDSPNSRLNTYPNRAWMLQRSSLPSGKEDYDGELVHNVPAIEMNHSMFDRE